MLAQCMQYSTMLSAGKGSNPSLHLAIDINQPEQELIGVVAATVEAVSLAQNGDQRVEVKRSPLNPRGHTDRRTDRQTNVILI